MEMKAREIAEQLQDSGYEQWAGRVRESVDTASTGTELIMGVLRNLLEFKKAHPELSPEVLAKIDSLILAINKELSRGFLRA